MKKHSYLKFLYLTTAVILSIITLVYFYKQTPKKNDYSSVKNIVFIIQSETMGGKGVYEMYQEMKKDGHNIKIIAIPNIYHGKIITNIDLDFTAKFDQNDMIYPCGKTEPYKQCEKINDDKIDYIFVQNPYNTYKDSILDPYYMNESLRKYTKKLMYVVYGPHVFHQHMINDTNLPGLVDSVFVDSESTKEIYKKYYKFPEDRVIVSGYQTYKSIRDLKENNKKSKQETILWLPRWVLTFKFRDVFEGGSTFMNYHYFFYNYAKNNPHINFIIRPHILLFSEATKGHYLSQNDLDEIMSKFRSLPNVTVSMHDKRSLVEDVLNSDIIISDGTSALGEVVVADKPIIYLSNGWNNEFNSNILSETLKKYIYLAYDPNDIFQYITHIRNTKYSPFKAMCSKIQCLSNKIKCQNICSREDFKKILDPVENPAKFISEYLIHDNPN